MESAHPINIECSVGRDFDVTGNKLVIFITGFITKLNFKLWIVVWKGLAVISLNVLLFQYYQGYSKWVFKILAPDIFIICW